MTNLPLLPSRITRQKSLLLGLIVTALLILPAGAAHASSGIEGVWSFGGGAVAVEATGGGGYQGTVVQPTKFAVCEHPIGQVMWSDMRERPDGSFWGLHVWYHGNECAVKPDPGLTAFRVISTTEGRILLVCFSKPGDASQPTIAPDGEVVGATYGCVESAPLAGIQAASGSKIGFEEILKLPAAQPDAVACRRTLSLIPKNPKYDPLARITVRIGGKVVANATGSKALHRPIKLTHLPEGRFRFRVLAITVLKHHFTHSGVYRGCKLNVHLHGGK